MKSFNNPQILIHTLEVTPKTLSLKDNTIWTKINGIRIVRKGIPLDGVGGFRALIRYLWEIYIFPNFATPWNWQEGDSIRFDWKGREIKARVTDVLKFDDDTGLHHLEVRAS